MSWAVHQQGNLNNAYCQDNEVSWYDWDNVDADLLSWTRAVLSLRKAHHVFRRRRFSEGRPLRHLSPDPALAEMGWFRPDGRLMTETDWDVGYAKSLGVLLNGPSLTEPDRYGRMVPDTSFYTRAERLGGAALVLPAGAQMGRAVAGGPSTRRTTNLFTGPACCSPKVRSSSRRRHFHGVPAALGSLNRSRPRLSQKAAFVAQPLGAESEVAAHDYFA